MREATIILGALGLGISAIFTLAAFLPARRHASFIPRVCGGSCRTLVDLPEARIAGVPNALLGLLFYAALLLLPLVRGGAGAYRGDDLAARILLAGAGIAVLLGITLTHTLLVRLRVRCLLCVASHAINAAILILLILQTTTTP